MKPADLGLETAIPDWRPGQLQTSLELATALGSDAPYMILEAPAGIGKSVIALAVASLLDSKPVHIVTGTKQLQEQYLRDAAALGYKAVMGRANFPCVIEPERTAAEAVCTVNGQCSHKNKSSCPYYAQKNEAQNAGLVIWNYAYWLAQMNYTAWTKPDLAVFDEAHVFEDELRRFAQVNVRHSHLLLLGVPEPGFSASTAAEYLGWASGVYYRVSEMALKKPKHGELSDADRRHNAAVISLKQGLVFLLNEDPENWIVRQHPWGIEFIPIWASAFFPTHVLAHTPKALFMSATILDKEQFCEQLGIPQDQAGFLRRASPFPAAHRPIQYSPMGRMGRNSDNMDRLVEAVALILDRHPDERGLVHTGNYKIAEHLMANLPPEYRTRLIWHRNASERRDALYQFRMQPGSVLLSPSMTMGVDLPYDLCRFQVIAKLCFPDLGDQQVKRRMKLGPDGEPTPIGKRWYTWMTACNLVQAYGRGCRAEDDYAMTYLLDGNWGWFRGAAKGLIPGWVYEAIRQEPLVTASSQGYESADDLLRKFA